MTTTLYELSDVNVSHLWETSAEMVDYLAAPMAPAELLSYLWQTDPEDPYFDGRTPNLTVLEARPESIGTSPETVQALARAESTLTDQAGLPPRWSTELRSIASTTSTPTSWSPTQRAIAVRAGDLVGQGELSARWLQDVLSSDFFATAETRLPLT